VFYGADGAQDPMPDDSDKKTAINSSSDTVRLSIYFLASNSTPLTQNLYAQAVRRVMLWDLNMELMVNRIRCPVILIRKKLLWIESVYSFPREYS
jgi:hypothetical protein